MSDIPPGLAAELETLERKHTQHPEGRYFVPLANAYRKAGDLDHAESLLRDGLEIHPDYLSAHIVLGRCHEDRGNGQEAEAQFQRVLARDPQNLVALQHLGDIASGDGRREDALRWYRELLGADPLNEGARTRLAELENAAESPSESAADDARWEEEGGLSIGAEEGDERAGSDEGALGLETNEAFSGLDVDDDEGDGAALALTREDDGTGELPAGGEDVETPEVGAEVDDFTAGDDADELGVMRFDEPEEPSDDEVWSVPLETPDDAAGMGSAGEDTEDMDGGEDPEVVTETIADLYARQGLFDRAAAVYRQLIRIHGEDERLRARLEEMESAAASDTEDEGSADEEVDAATPEAPDQAKDDYAFADSFAHGFVGNEPAEEEAAPEHPLHADTIESEVRAAAEDAEPLDELAPIDVNSFSAPAAAEAADEDVRAGEPEAARPIGGYLRDLLGWTPDAPAADTAAAGTDAADAEGADVDAGGTDAIADGEEPWDEQPAWGGVGGDEPSAASQAPFTTEDAVGDLPEPPTGEAAADETTAEEDEPWMMTPLEPDEAAPPAEEAREEDEFSFEDFFDAGDEVDEDAPPAREDAGDEASRGDAGAAEPQGAEDESDDDLESFQAWLQSLKR